MRIAISGMFWNQPTVGSGQYLRGLLDGLARIAPEHEYILLLPGNDQRPTTTDQGLTKAAPVVLGLSSFVVRTPFDRRSENLAKLWLEQVGVPLAAARLGADVLHVPYFAPPLRSAVPVVTTVLDIIPLVLPEYRGGPAIRAYMRLVSVAARRAAQVIAISDHSRRDIVRHLGCPPDRVTTIHLAAGRQYQPLDRIQARAQVAERYGLRDPFVYYIGGLDARKNVQVLLRAWRALRRAGAPPATLAVAGRAIGRDPRLFPDLDVLIADLGIQDTVARIDVPHADGALLYNAATVFAFPSRYEGFGLGPLEAMACGTPVVAADASSLPEVVGEAALRVAPDSVQAWTSALWRLLADAGLREDLSRRGIERAGQFSYDRTARQTVEIYARACERPSTGRRVIHL